jgi:hypothetical protein
MELLFTTHSIPAGRPETELLSPDIGSALEVSLVRDLTNMTGKGDQVYALFDKFIRSAPVLAGANAPATLWAAYELIENGECGLTWMESLPERPRCLRGFNEPSVPVRRSNLDAHNLHVEVLLPGESTITSF